MKKEDILLSDWQRIFLGDVPGGFYWEVVLRIAVIYIILMVSMRLMGKRMASQLSRNEMIAMVSLAAAIGVPLQAPDRGILAAVIIAAVVIFVQQTLAKLATRNQRLESITQGNLSILVSDGKLIHKKMERTGITKEKAFSQLRSRGIRHLGEVKRLYFEADGSFTLIRNGDIGPGLCILPEADIEYVIQSCTESKTTVCKRCGAAAQQPSTPCPECGSRERVHAVVGTNH